MKLQIDQFNLGKMVRDELTNISVQFLRDSERRTYKHASSIYER
jgi:hypothetical protein